MAASVLAGRFAPRSGATADLGAALARDGVAEVADLGAFALAWTAGAVAPAGTARTLCAIDGRPRTGALAADLGLEPATQAERVVAAGYEQLGDGVLERVTGEFALVLWDREAGRGLLARDRLGMRPLFVAEAGGALLFASEVRNLLALLPRRPAPDPTAVAHWLARTRAHGDLTLYSGIRRIPAAHLITLGGHDWRVRRWWRPRYAEPRPVDRRQAEEAVRDELTAAVADALDGAARPAVMLSGGLDSAAVAAVAPRPLRTYSAVFPELPEVDEAERIERVRDWLGLEGVEESFREASALAAAAEFVEAWELPSVSPNLLVWTPLLRRAAADGVDVVLDGEGGDELFGVARYLVADRLLAGRPLAALRTARRLPGMGARPRGRWLARAITRYGARPALPAGLHERLRHARGRGTEAPPWLADEPARLHRAADDPWAWKRSPGPRWWAELAYTLTGGGDALGAPDQLRREGLLAGVELRHPLRDERLVELVLGLRPELAFDPHLDRPLVRRALAGHLPPETLESDHKPAFNSVLAGALAGPDREALRALLRDPHPDLAARVRRSAVEAMLEAGSGPRRGTLDVWRIAQLELWLRHCADPGSALAGAEPAGEPAIEFIEQIGRSRQDF